MIWDENRAKNLSDCPRTCPLHNLTRCTNKSFKQKDSLNPTTFLKSFECLHTPKRNKNLSI